MLRISHANGTYDSRDSPRHTRSAGDGRRLVPGHRNVAGPPTLSAPWAARASQQRTGANPPNQRRHTHCGLRITHWPVLSELEAGAAARRPPRSPGELWTLPTPLEPTRTPAT